MRYEDCGILRRMGVPADKIHKTAIVCGDTKRFPYYKALASSYKEYEPYLVYRAVDLVVNDQPMLLICHGVSATSASIIFRELLECGVKILIRSGSSGTYNPDRFKAGDLFIIYGAIRDDTISLKEIDIGYPAAAHPDVVDALMDNSKKYGINTTLGISFSTDLFYRDFNKVDIKYEFLKSTDVDECETAILFLLSALYGAKAGCIDTIDGCSLRWAVGNYYHSDETFLAGIENMIKLVAFTAADLNRTLE